MLQGFCCCFLQIEGKVLHQQRDYYSLCCCGTEPTVSLRCVWSGFQGHSLNLFAGPASCIPPWVIEGSKPHDCYELQRFPLLLLSLAMCVYL